MRRFNFIAVIALIAGVSYAAIEPISSPPTTSPKMSVGTGGIKTTGRATIGGELTVVGTATVQGAALSVAGTEVVRSGVLGSGIIFNAAQLRPGTAGTGAYVLPATSSLDVGSGGLTATASTTTLSRLDVGGKIGISSPTANSLLSIDGNPGGNPLVSVINSLNDSTKLLHIGTQNNYFDFWRDHTTGHLNIQGSQSGANSIVLAPTSGAVGIGTTSPGSLFTVSANTFTVASSGIVSAPSQPAVRAYLTADQNIQTASWTPVMFGSESYDSASMHSLTVSSGNVTIPAGGTGLYYVKCAVYFDVNATGRRMAGIFNGATTISINEGPASAALSYNTDTVSVVSATAGDVLTCQAYQSSGGDLLIKGVADGYGTSFEVVKLW